MSFSEKPWGILVAAALAWVALAYPPWPRVDAAGAARLRGALAGEGPPAVAIGVDPRDATMVTAVTEWARGAGAAAVEGPSASLAVSDAQVPEIDGAAVLR